MKIALVKSDNQNVRLSDFRKLSKSDRGDYVAEIYLKATNKTKTITLKIDLDIHIADIKLVHYRAKQLVEPIRDTEGNHVRITYSGSRPLYKMQVSGQDNVIVFNVDQITNATQVLPHRHLIRMYIKVVPAWTVFDTTNFIRKEVGNVSHNFLNKEQAVYGHALDNNLAAFKYLYMFGPHVLRNADLLLAPESVAAFCANQIDENELTKAGRCDLYIV